VKWISRGGAHGLCAINGRRRVLPTPSRARSVPLDRSPPRWDRNSAADRKGSPERRSNKESRVPTLPVVQGGAGGAAVAREAPVRRRQGQGRRDLGVVGAGRGGGGGAAVEAAALRAVQVADARGQVGVGPAPLRRQRVQGGGVRVVVGDATDEDVVTGAAVEGIDSQPAEEDVAAGPA